MSYVICNNSQYLHLAGDGIRVTASYADATKWKEIHKANNVLNSLNQKKYGSYNFKVQVAIQEQGTIIPPAKPVNMNYNLVEQIKNIKVFVKNLEDRRLFLMSQIQILDLELVDIQHAAEFYDLSASQGYKLYKLMHEVTIKRRGFKNELQQINLLLGTTLKTENIENLEKSIQGMDSRRYTPRIHKELFNV